MKKFLTVLLALSVVFTYTVGTAFAATNDESTFNGNVNLAQSQVVRTLNTAYDNMVEGLTAKTKDNVEISKAAWTSVASKYKEVQSGLITTRTNEIKKKYNDLGDKTVAELVELYSEAKGDANSFGADAPVLTQSGLATGLEADTDLVNEAARYQFGLDKAAALDALQNADLSMFSTTVQAIPGQAKDTSYYALAKAVIDDAVTEVKAVIIASDAAATDVAKELTKIGKAGKSAYTDALKVKHAAVNGTGFLEVIENVLDIEGEATTAYQFSEKAITDNSLLTKTGEDNAAVGLDAKKAAKLSTVAANAATYYASVVGDASKTKEDIDAAKKLKDAYVTVWTYVINAAKTENELNTNTTNLAAITGSEKFAENIAAIEDLEKYAAKYKAEKDLSGNLVRDAKLVDKVVAAAKLDAYKITTAWDGETTVAELNSGAKTKAETLIHDHCNVASLSNYAKEKAKADYKAELNDFEDNNTYYALELAKVKELYAAAIAKIDAAVRDAELTDIDTELDTAVAKVAKAADVDALFTTGGVLASAFKDASDKLLQYETLLNTGVSADDQRDFAKAGLDDATKLAKLYAENGVRTEAELKAFYDTAVAKIKAVKSKSQLETARKAVETMIAALPAKITVADKAAVKAAWEAKEAYVKENGATDDIANTNTLSLAITALAKAELKEIAIAYANLPTTVTVADKAAVKAVKDAIDAYTEEFTGGMYKGGTACPTNVTKQYTDIRALELKALKDKIDAIPVNVTKDDKATVEAARAALDAFVSYYTDYENDYNPLDNAVIPTTYQKTLTEAEATIAAAEKNYNEYLKMGVKGTTIKIYSKAYKKYTKISWKKSLGFKVDGYEVYRSTKKNTGFKKIWTAKSTGKSVNNTKNRISGKKYYYYVKGFRMLDGEKVYTKKSITIYRTAK